MSGTKGMRKAIRWDDATRETILAAWQKLRDDGWKRISIRKTLYQLLDLPGWTKKHYDTMCTKTGKWRDDGDMRFGLFSDEGGADHVPMTPSEIADALEALRDATPAVLGPDGYLHLVLWEHAGDVDDVADMLDGAIVVSSGGQIRREHLHRVMEQCVGTCSSCARYGVPKREGILQELGGKGIRALMVVDYDKGGEDIYQAHRRWLKRIFRMELKKWGVTPAQVRAAGLPVHEDHQLEGWSGRYGRERLERELRAAIGLAAR